MVKKGWGGGECIAYNYVKNKPFNSLHCIYNVTNNKN